MSSPPPLPTPVLLFDLDGTLTDSAPGILDGFRYALASIGGPDPTPELLATVVGPPMVDTFRSMGIDDERTARAVAAYFERYDEGGGWADNRVYDGIEPILSALTARGIRLGVATSKFEGYAQRILHHFALDSYFEFVGGASKDLSRRAKADVVEHTLRNMGVEPIPEGTEGVALVGDREHDVSGAAKWGVPTVHAGWGYGRPGESEGATWVADTISDLAEVLHVEP